MESMELSEELDDTEPIDPRRGRSIDRYVETFAGSLSFPLDWFLISGRLAGIEVVFWLLLLLMRGVFSRVRVLNLEHAHG